MRWIAKAAAQGALSALPGGRAVNYQLQRHVSRRLPRRDADFDAHARAAATHLAALARARPDADTGALYCYEFGAGWDLIGPIALWMLGVNRQTVIDVRANIKLELINDTVSRFGRDRTRMEEVLRSPLRTIDRAPVRSAGDLAPRFGIDYLAPCDARATPLPDASIDLATNTFVLEHIPPGDIAAILADTRRILTPAGVVSSLIDMHDHYTYADPNVSAHDFLRYPAWAWSLLNPRLGWQSRLRHPQYVDLFRSGGYEILEDTPQHPSESELEALRRMRVAREFAQLATADLGIKATHLVAAPRR